MKLHEELGLRRGFTLLPHEALLNIYYTSSRIKKRAGEFFRQYGLTDVQFNLMMLLIYQSEEHEGLTQVDLSRMMLVNRANITTLIDRMEKADLVMREPVPGDRRYNIVKLTEHGRQKVAEVEAAYAAEVEKIMAPLNESELQALSEMLERIRESV
jgi:MarR family 2-MHQ and catechol resistance regulon transcriptional repressor